MVIDKIKKLFPKFKSIVEISPKLAEKYEKIGKNVRIKKEGNKIFLIVNNPFISIGGRAEDLRIIPELFIKNIGLVREDIAQEELIILLNKKSVELLKKIKPFMDEEDKKALAYASTMIELENRGIDVIDMRDKLFRACKGRGVRIYSLLRSKVLQRDILPLIDEYEKIEEGSWKNQMAEIIRGMIKDMISYHPNVIYVHSDMKQYELLGEIYKRKEEEFFEIFARGKCIKLAKNVIDKFIKQNPNYTYIIDSYPPEITNAIRIHVMKKIKKETK